MNIVMLIGDFKHIFRNLSENFKFAGNIMENEVRYD